MPRRPSATLQTRHNDGSGRHMLRKKQMSNYITLEKLRKKKHLVNIELRELNCDIPTWYPSRYTVSIYLSWFDKYVIVFRRRTPRNMKFLFGYAIGFIKCTPRVSPCVCIKRNRTRPMQPDAFLAVLIYPNICVASLVHGTPMSSVPATDRCANNIRGLRRAV